MLNYLWTDHQALRSRAAHEMGCPRRRIPPGLPRLVPSVYSLLVSEVLGHCLRFRCHRQSEPLPRHPRDLAQPSFQEPSRQPTDCHVCQPANWHSLQRFFPSTLSSELTPNNCQPLREALANKLRQQPYHLTHHKSLGVDGLDTDLPTAFEAVVLNSILGKAFFCTFQIFFYALRPMAVYRVPLTPTHFLNIAVQLIFDAVLIHYTSFHAFLYLILSSFLAGSLHPLAGHFIAEHYVYETVTPSAKDPENRIPVPETFSYYGPLNWFTYNVGLHNEHHDFPAVPWTRLHAVRDIAHEFYDDLPRHESWVYAIWRFILDENVGMTCRVKRKEGGRMVGGAATANWKESEIQA